MTQRIVSVILLALDQPHDIAAPNDSRRPQASNPPTERSARNDPIGPDAVLLVDDGRQAEGACDEGRQCARGGDHEHEDGCFRREGQKAEWGVRQARLVRERQETTGSLRTLKLGSLVDRRSSQDSSYNAGKSNVIREREGQPSGEERGDLLEKETDPSSVRESR